MPCGDKDDCNEVKHEQTSQTKNENHSDEVCSPFCVCACCGCQSFNVEPLPVVTIALSQSNENKVTPFESQFLSQFSANIWQPPKVA